MELVAALVDLIDASIADWNAEFEVLLFNSADPAVIAQLISERVTQTMPRPCRPRSPTGVGIVVGLDLDDGSRDVLNVARSVRVAMLTPHVERGEPNALARPRCSNRQQDHLDA